MYFIDFWHRKRKVYRLQYQQHPLHLLRSHLIYISRYPCASPPKEVRISHCPLASWRSTRLRTLDFSFAAHGVARYRKRVRSNDSVVGRSDQLLLGGFEGATQLLLHDVLLFVPFLSGLLVCNSDLQFLFSFSLIIDYALAFCSELASLPSRNVQSLIGFVVCLLQSPMF